MFKADLHCHSHVSDGLLSPADVAARAHAHGVELFALTDHDDVSGLQDARRIAAAAGMDFVDGVEISVTWRATTLHIVGLGIDPDHAELRAGLAQIRAGRGERARRIAAALHAAGIAGALQGAMSHAHNPELVGRTHFARHIVASGRAKDIRSVFRHYLVKGKPGYVSHEWASLAQAVGWIRAAGGCAVLAHPARYELSRPAMQALLQEFKALGGAALEVVAGSHTPDQSARFARLAAEWGLLASCGSDFHAPGEGGREVGRLAPIPPGCEPVWRLWREAP